jgi:hypothetical protein
MAVGGMTEREGSPQQARAVPKGSRVLEVRCPDRGCLLLVVERWDVERFMWRLLEMNHTPGGLRMDNVSNVITTELRAPSRRLRVQCRCLPDRVELDAAKVNTAVARHRPGRRNVARLADLAAS